MTKQEQIDKIKKSLAVCVGASCDGCAYHNDLTCIDTLKTDARKCIIKQEKEIEKLKAENKQLKTECALLDDELRIARQDTINVLNELKGNIKNAIDTYYNSQGGSYYSSEDVINDIDKMIKELVK